MEILVLKIDLQNFEFSHDQRMVKQTHQSIRVFYSKIKHGWR